MSILEGVKATNIKSDKARFIIKSKPSIRDTKDQYNDQYACSSDSEANLFIEYMITKSERLKELICKKNIFNHDQFYSKHLFESICLKTLLKQVLQRMMADRRLGKSLKGMNKSNLVQIQNLIWSVVQREASLYKNQLEYNRQKKRLQDQLKQRKAEIEAEINNIKKQSNTRDAFICLTEPEYNEAQLQCDQNQ